MFGGLAVLQAEAGELFGRVALDSDAVDREAKRHAGAPGKGARSPGDARRRGGGGGGGGGGGAATNAIIDGGVGRMSAAINGMITIAPRTATSATIVKKTV